MLWIVVFSLHCATYWNNRRKDFQDIAHLGLETPVYGAGVRIGPLPLGVYFAGGETEMGKRDLGTGWGLRGGELGKYRSQQLVLGFLGGEKFHSGDALVEEGKEVVDIHGIPIVDDERSNIKSYKMRYFSYFNDPVEERQKRKKEEFRRAYIEKIIRQTGQEELRAYIPEKEKKPFGYPPGFLWQLDLFIGAFGGVRAGINVAEILDFLLGFLGADILEDDVYSSD